jgi:hypothetical protein
MTNVPQEENNPDLKRGSHCLAVGKRYSRLDPANAERIEFEIQASGSIDVWSRLSPPITHLYCLSFEILFLLISASHRVPDRLD